MRTAGAGIERIALRDGVSRVRPLPSNGATRAAGDALRQSTRHCLVPFSQQSAYLALDKMKIQ
jgi:hypothetical protein